MSTVVDEILAANARYVDEFGERRQLPLPPARQVAILTCMDARLDPAHFAGLKEGDAHVIRNAGGRASDDAIRSLVISHKLLGTQEFLVIHHTNCGMQLFTGDVMGELLAQSLDTAVLDGDRWRDVGTGPGSDAGRAVDWLTFRDLRQSVSDDVLRIRRSPLIPATLPVRGFIYDVTTGGLQEVEVPDA